MANRRDRSDGRSTKSAAAKPADAAVRRALVEARSEFLTFLRRRLGNREEVDEILQRFSLRALERAAELRDVQSVRGWLGRILATAIVDHQRRAGRSREREVALDTAGAASLAVEPDSEVDGAVCNCLHKVLPSLKPEYADMIWRADLLGEPRDRIAASLGVTLSNVAVRLHRGRHALRKRLEEMCLTCPVHGFLDCRCEEAERIRQQRAAVTGATGMRRPRGTSASSRG
jgi:RNA polymerase sigma-70 factor (ECF subfamily)